MDILIISVNRNALPVPVMPVGACIIAEAAREAGHRVRVLDLMFKKNPLSYVRDELKRAIPDIIGISVRNIDNNNMRNPAWFLEELSPIVKAIKSLTDVPIILGGSAIAVMPEEILRYTRAFCAVIGEGETVFPKLLECLSSGGEIGSVQGVAWLEDGVFKKTHPPPPSGALSVPDFRRWIDLKGYLSRMSTVPLQSKLGCGFHCIYCTYRKIEGGFYRVHSPLSVLDAIRRLRASGIRDIEFVDNVFNAPYEHAMEVTEAISRAGLDIRFHSVELNPLRIDDELITTMEKAGFAGVGITVESASDKVLTGLRKGFSAKDVYNAAEVMRRHGIPCLWIFLLGGPGETKKTVTETLRFAENIVRPGDAAFFNVGIRIYPGTELESIARRQGALSASASEMLEPVFYVSPEVEFEWISVEVRKSMSRHMNFLSSDSISLPCLNTINRFGYFLGIRPPLWRHTGLIRRVLRLMGKEV